MSGPVESANPSELRFSAEKDEENRKLVLLELEKVLASPSFRSAARSRQFLTYVIQHQLEGHSELLKERTIGTEVFLRPPGYATGDDPVVRVQAGEVRRRLDQYYQSAPRDSHVRIELPVGAYSPVFHWFSNPVPAERAPVALQPAADTAPRRNRMVRWGIAALCAIMLLGVGAAFFTWNQTAGQKSVFEQFWEPLFATQQPALICLAKGVTYRPILEVYQRYARTHPGAFQTEVQRSNDPLPLDANEKLTWGELQLYDGYGVALGDVSSAVKFSTLLGKIGKPNQVRIGANYSFEDLRNSPAVVVGAFNNRWTIDLMSNQHFAFVEEKGGDLVIQERTPGGRAWESLFGKRNVVDEDYAIVARLLDSKTGQFIVVAAGLRDSGTEAAGEFASNPADLEAALRNAPAGWQKKNLEIVLKTTVTDSIPGPPQVVATYYWK